MSRPWSSHLWALAATVLVIVLRYAQDAIFGVSPHTLLPFTIAVLVAAWHGGWRSGLFGLLLNTLVAAYLAIEPGPPWFFATGELMRVVDFIVVGVLIILLFESLHGYRRKAETHAQRAIQRQVQLEHEIKERQGAEERLRASEEQMRLVTDNAPVLLVHCDAEQRYKFANRAYTQRFGLTPAQVIGKQISEIVGPQAYARFRHYVESALAGKRAEFEVEVPYKRIGRRWMHTVYEPQQDENGVRGFIGMILDVTERVRSEELLRESEERYRLLTEALPHMVWTMRPDLSLEFVNGRTYEFTGLKPLDLSAMASGWAPLIHPDDRPKALETIAGSMRRGESHELEYRLWDRTGSYRWVLSRAVPLRDEFGTVVKWIGTTLDIHDRWLAESKFRVAVEASPVGVFIADADGKILLANSPFEQMFGYAKGELFGARVETLIPERYRREHQGHRSHYFANPETKAMGLGRDLAGLRKDGSEFPVEIGLKPVPMESGLHVLASVIDITSRRVAEQQLREMNATLEWLVAERTQLLQEKTQVLETVLDSMGDAVLVVDREGRILLRNRAFLQMHASVNDPGPIHEWPRELGVYLPGGTDFCPADQLPILRACRGEATDDVELELVDAKNPGGLPISVTGRPLRATEGIAGGVVVIRDVSARKRAEARVRASLREKETLLKEIHHRVKNNLQIIYTLLDLQSDHIRDPHALDLFKQSRGRVKSMALIHERLYRSQDLARVDLGEYIRQLAEDLLDAYSVPRDRIDVSVDVSIPPVPIDTAIPCGLLLNELITNCLKHAFPPGSRGRIRVQLRGAGNGTSVLTVADNGSGIPEDFDYLYPPSFGFQLVNTLVKQLKGELKVHSDGGTAIIVTFSEHG